MWKVVLAQVCVGHCGVLVLVLWLVLCSCVRCDVCFRTWRDIVWIGMGAVVSV